MKRRQDCFRLSWTNALWRSRWAMTSELISYTLKNQRLKIAQLEKARWTKIISNWVILVFSLYACCCYNASELFCMAYLASIERFLYHSNLSSFKYQVLYTFKLTSLSWWKSTQVREGAFYSFPMRKHTFSHSNWFSSAQAGEFTYI